jgi:hypothetical protein
LWVGLPRTIGNARNKAVFKPGETIAMNVPAEAFDLTVAFDRDVMGLPVRRATAEGSVVFEFGSKNLGVGRVPTYSQAES